MRHSWKRDATVIQWTTYDAKKYKCIKCGLIRWSSGYGARTEHLYKRGNRYVGDGPFGTDTPPCQQP